jgi:hypothetical protein
MASHQHHKFYHLRCDRRLIIFTKLTFKMLGLKIILGHARIYIISIVKKVKFSRYKPRWLRGWVEVYLYPFLTAALEGSEWSAARPNRTLPPGNTRYPLYRRMGGPQGQSGRAENLAPLGFDPRTVQPVVSRHTD